jgi:hypothetical protein
MQSVARATEGYWRDSGLGDAHPQQALNATADPVQAGF